MQHRSVIGLVVLGLAACDSAGPSETLDPVTVESVSPAAGTTRADPLAPVIVRFSKAMQAGAEIGMDVHRGGAAGGVVAGHWSWSMDRRTATFTPSGPFVAGLLHTIHLGGELAGADGEPVNFEHCIGIGGAWVGGQPGGWMHGGAAGGPGHGWMHRNGSYGMGFAFTTAGTPPSAVTIASVTPAPGATGVDIGTTVVVEFTDAMPDPATDFMDVHAAGSGTIIPGEWTWDSGHRVATFTPGEPLEPLTRYVVHIGGRLVGIRGDPLDFQYCRGSLGGQWVDGELPAWRHGHHGQPGEDWRHANGAYGVMFSFTTA